ncbi:MULTISPECIES: hypothetical protein [unclassified Streptomyces]|uniref:hypothetical protein n=1 Tax=unclassified Streptomyces TaxID=2593676 RepID=UPI003D9399D2
MRAANQLHALLRDLLPGGAPVQLSATAAAGLLRRIRPTGPIETVREPPANDLIAELRRLKAQLAANAEQLREAVEASRSTLMDTPGSVRCRPVDCRPARGDPTGSPPRRTRNTS